MEEADVPCPRATWLDERRRLFGYRLGPIGSSCRLAARCRVSFAKDGGRFGLRIYHFRLLGLTASVPCIQQHEPHRFQQARAPNDMQFPIYIPTVHVAQPTSRLRTTRRHALTAPPHSGTSRLTEDPTPPPCPPSHPTPPTHPSTLPPSLYPGPLHSHSTNTDP